MNFTKNYKTAFFIALGMHLMVALLLVLEPSSQSPVLASAHAPTNIAAPLALQETKQAISAVSVNSEEVKHTIDKLRQERLQQKQAEENRQNKLMAEAEQAKKQRIAEQQRLEKMKNEAAKLAIVREEKMKQEQQQLKELAKQKANEEKRLAEMKQQQVALKKQQVEEAKHLDELKKKKATETAQLEAAKQAKLKEELLKQQQAAARQATLDAQRNAEISGEVNKYKALIIGAIGRQWILPENVNPSLSSQFRIRLAPNGSVLEVSLTRSSGDAILDRSAQSAIYKASPLPVPSDADTFNLFRDITLTVRPENVRG